MSYSWVTAIAPNQDGSKVTVSVKVDGFEPGTAVEISGYATQASGTIATFCDVQEMPANGGQGALMVVADVPVLPPGGFSAGVPIVVVARAADVWVTTMVQGAASDNTQGGTAAWESTEDDYHPALSPSTKAAPYGQGPASP